MPDRPDLAALLADPARVADVPNAGVPALLDAVTQQAARLEVVKALLAARLATPTGKQREGRLLPVGEAAGMLATTDDWLRRHAAELPFTVWLSDGQLRFSLLGIEDYIDAKCGQARRRG